MRGTYRASLPLALLLALPFAGCEAGDPAALGPDEATARWNDATPRPSGVWRTHLTGGAEAVPVDTRATGQALFQLSEDGTELSYRLIVANIEDVLMSHIHMAPEGANGPVVAWLYPSAPPPSLIEGRFSGVLAEGVITAANLVGPLAGQSMADLVAAIEEGRAYVNVHTLAHPGGEIRGQI